MGGGGGYMSMQFTMYTFLCVCFLVYLYGSSQQRDNIDHGCTSSIETF